MNCLRKNEEDVLLNDLNNYHPNINLTLELNWKRFLDTNLKFENGILIQFNIGYLHRSRRISTDFTKEKVFIKNKLKKQIFQLNL